MCGIKDKTRSIVQCKILNIPHVWKARPATIGQPSIKISLSIWIYFVRLISIISLTSFDLYNLGYDILCHRLVRKSYSLFVKIDLYFSEHLLTVVNSSRLVVVILIIIKCCIRKMSIAHVSIILWCHYYNYRPFACWFNYYFVSINYKPKPKVAILNLFLNSLSYLLIYVY